MPISLTRSGCPRIIPSFHRRMIYKRDDKADLLVKLYLSFFTLSKLIKLCPKISKKTEKSITQPDQVLLVLLRRKYLISSTDTCPESPPFP